ncbi:HipA domain-containing protein [Motiliproteus sp. SC1-56]|uniref:HipA domain-containing protein n=1 Tax=Motiliproteus sp. SC1-56 TaxID=2799565 RepID=UPI001A8D27DA|nr:HipA domain-containing protein [Motiliproteus sp. SC1-56]
MPAQEVRRLIVWCNQEKIGALEEYNGLWAFEYHSGWNGFDIAPDLPRESGRIEDGGSFRPVQWFFDNLLPEENARTLLARDAKIDQADAFGLLSHFGAESAGALTLLRVDEAPVFVGESPLTFNELSQRIRNLPRVPLSSGASKRMSLAGAQHKLPIVFRDGALFEPAAATPSTHILKPEHSEPEDHPHSVVNEWFVMTLAKRLKIDVPDCQMLAVPQPVYLVERFDREMRDDTLMRRHVLDGCQLLSLDRNYKYSQCTLASLERLVDLCRMRGQTRQRLFQWLLFNLLVGNTDDHLKNLSFFAGPEGITLAPHYDLLSTAIYQPAGLWGRADLVWPVGEAKQLGQVRLRDLLQVAEAMKLPASFVNRSVKFLAGACRQAAEALITELQSAGETGAGREGELHFLRQLRFGVMEDMLRQLEA